MSHLPQELEEELEVESLLRHALLPLSPLTRASGYTNEVWIGESYVVRLNGGRLRDSLRHERDVLVFLPDDIPHAKPLAYGRREHRGEYLILERLPGRNLDEVWGELSIDSRKSAASQLATFVQKLHSLPFSQVMGNPWLQLAIDNCLFGDAYHAHPRHFMQQIQGAIGLSDLDRGLIREVQQLLETRLSVFDDALDVFVHSDIHFRNVLWSLLFANLGLPALGEATAGGKGSGRNSASQRHNRAMGRAGAAAFHPTRTVAALARKRVVRGLACAAGARFAASGSDIAPAAHARTGGRVTQS